MRLNSTLSRAVCSPPTIIEHEQEQMCNGNYGVTFNVPAGRTTSTHCMAYLDSGYVFLGSKGGDSQLIKLHAEPLPTAAAAGAPAGPISSLAADDDAAAAAAAGSGSAAAAAGGDEGPNHVEVVDSWPSLAPIVDFVVMDLERQGQGQVGLPACIVGLLLLGSSWLK